MGFVIPGFVVPMGDEPGGDIAADGADGGTTAPFAPGTGCPFSPGSGCPG